MVVSGEQALCNCIVDEFAVGHSPLEIIIVSLSLMARTNLYFKVELDNDEGEQLEPCNGGD